MPIAFSRRLQLGLVVLPLALGLVAFLGAKRLEQAVRKRIEDEAARHGLEARMDAVRVGLWPPLRIEGLRVSKPGAFVLAAPTAGVSLRPFGTGLVGRTRLSLGPTTLTTAQGLALEAQPTVWDLAVLPDGRRADLRSPRGGLAVRWTGGADATGEAEAVFTNLAVGELLTVRRGSAVLLDLGRVSGVLRLSAARGRTTTFTAELAGESLRVAALAAASPAGAAEPPGFGLPTSLILRVDGSWNPGEGRLELPHWSVTTEGAAASGTLVVADLPQAPRVDLSLEIQRVDFARVLKASGLAEPDALASEGAAREGSLGSASLSARVTGRLAEAASFTVSQKLDFTPPKRALPALERLRGDFVHEVQGAGGALHEIPVSPSSPDFIAMGEVPPLFVRTLLLAEDSGFFGHHGIDLSEVPSALVSNWAGRGPIRGASTITQQLAKNLFFSHEKRVGRKLQELAVALLLETTLGKERILEIYLNVIEWGPDLYGLRPAARRYFGCEPRDLTPAQGAFLVSVIPGPVKYQRSFADGRPSPGFRPLIDDLLAKLRSVDALSEEQYREALAEDLVILKTQASP